MYIADSYDYSSDFILETSTRRGTRGSASFLVDPSFLGSGAQDTQQIRVAVESSEIRILVTSRLFGWDTEGLRYHTPDTAGLKEISL